MVLEDPNAAFSVEKVQELGGVFFKPEDEIANFGFSKSAWWAKFTINNDLGSTQKVYLEHSYPVIDYVSLYYKQDGVFQEKHLGEYVAQSDDAFFYRAPVFEIDIPNGFNTYYLRIKTEGSSQFPLTLRHPSKITNHIGKEIAFVWMLYGFLVVMILYNGFLYITYRDKSFLIYVFYIMLSLLSNSGLHGWWKPFLGGWNTYINELLICIGCLYTFSANYFTIYFLELKKRIYNFYLVYMVLQGLILINIFAVTISYKIGTLFYILFINISGIVMLTCGVVSSKQKFRPAYWFTLARFSMLVCALPYMLSLLKILPLKAVTIWGGLTGIALETVLISFALGDKMRFIQQRDEKRIKFLNATLEQKVEDRTLQLAKKNSDLSSAIDENKGLIRILCHDLNNTLCIIKQASQRILSKMPNLPQEKQIELCKKIERAAKTQEDIIEHVRNMEVISSGKLELKLKPTSINEIVDNCRFIFEDPLKQKKLSLNFISDLSSEAYVMADPVTLSNNVFNNLVSNSIKFSLPGKSIDIKVESLTENRVKIIIRDYGIGMPEHIKQNVFLPDRQTSRTGTGGEVGTGFGMSLVKAYMDYYNGSISVESYEQSSCPDNHGTKYVLIFDAAIEEKVA